MTKQVTSTSNREEGEPDEPPDGQGPINMVFSLTMVYDPRKMSNGLVQPLDSGRNEDAVLPKIFGGGYIVFVQKSNTELKLAVADSEDTLSNKIPSVGAWRLPHLRQFCYTELSKDSVNDNPYSRIEYTFDCYRWSYNIERTSDFDQSEFLIANKVLTGHSGAQPLSLGTSHPLDNHKVRKTQVNNKLNIESAISSVNATWIIIFLTILSTSATQKPNLCWHRSAKRKQKQQAGLNNSITTPLQMKMKILGM